MKNKSDTASYFLLCLCLVGCSVELDQPIQATPSHIVKIADATPTVITADKPSLPSGSTRPVTWSGLNLTGRLVYTRRSSNNDVSSLSVEVLNLVNGEIETIFTAPEEASIYYTTVSPVREQVILSLASPLSADFLPNQALYILPLDGSAPPQLLVAPPTESDSYIQVEWSLDGKYIYFVHTNYQSRLAGQVFPNYEIFRMAYPDGQPERILEHAFWPRVSSNSSKLVYVSLDPDLGKNELFIADADGSNPRQVKLNGDDVTHVIDAPIFAPDGQTIFFSAPNPTQSYQPNWFEKLTGVLVAKAHNLPSDWWSVPVAGGDPARLTHTQSINLFASLSPDQKRIVSFSLDGLFVMDMDGSNLTSLIPDPGGSTVSWIP